MHLVINHVSQFQHVDHTHGCRLVETFSRSSVIQIGGSESRHTCLVRVFVDIVQRGTIKNRSCKLQSQILSGPTQHGFEYLSQVHTGRHTQRIQTNINRSSVRQERHILYPYHAGYNTLVTVTSCHLITDLQFTFLSHVNLSHLDNSGRKLVTDGSVILLTFNLSFDLLVLDDIIMQQVTDHIVSLLIGRPLVRVDLQEVHVLQHLVRELHSLRNNILVQVILHALRSLTIYQLE